MRGVDEKHRTRSIHKMMHSPISTKLTKRQVGILVSTAAQLPVVALSESEELALRSHKGRVAPPARHSFCLNIQEASSYLDRRHFGARAAQPELFLRKSCSSSKALARILRDESGVGQRASTCPRLPLPHTNTRPSSVTHAL